MFIRHLLALFAVLTCLHPALAQERYKFAFVTHGGPGNPFWNVVIKGMKDAAKRYDVDVQWLSSPTFSIADMPNFLDDAIANKVNGMASPARPRSHSGKRGTRTRGRHPHHRAQHRGPQRRKRRGVAHAILRRRQRVFGRSVQCQSHSRRGGKARHDCSTRRVPHSRTRA